MKRIAAAVVLAGAMAAQASTAPDCKTRAGWLAEELEEAYRGYAGAEWRVQAELDRGRRDLALERQETACQLAGKLARLSEEFPRRVGVGCYECQKQADPDLDRNRQEAIREFSEYSEQCTRHGVS